MNIIQWCCPSCAAEDIPALILGTFLGSLILIPFFYLSYLLVEFLQNKHKDKLNKLVTNQSKFGPIVGAATGLIPQCGFSSTMALLFTQKVLTIGTLFAVLIATSDEAMFVLIANREFKTLIVLLSLKFLLAVIVGYIIDFIFRKKEYSANEIQELENPCSCCVKTNNIFLTALKQTIRIYLFVLVFSIIINVLVYVIGEDVFETLLLNGSIFQPIIACLIGLIPNCAASILLTNLYISGTVSFASLFAGLMCNAGMASIILFRYNKKIKQNFILLGTLLLISILTGMFITLITMLF